MLRQYMYLQTLLKGRVKSERGATAVEYGLLVVLIAAVIVVIVATLGTQIQGGFNDVSTTLSENGADGGTGTGTGTE